MSDDLTQDQRRIAGALRDRRGITLDTSRPIVPTASPPTEPATAPPVVADDLTPDYESPSLPSQARVVRKGKFITEEALAERDARMVAAGRRQAADALQRAADSTRETYVRDAFKLAARIAAGAPAVTEEGTDGR